jgi:hypothetical protein
MTEERYLKEVSEIKKIDPDNLFLKTLQIGYSSVNEVYLNAAWKIANKKLKNKAEPSNSHSQPTNLNLDYLNELFRKKGHIGRQMRQIKATQLNTASNKAERKAIMIELDKLQDEWAIIHRQVKIYEATGEISDVQKVNHNADATLEERIADLKTVSDLSLADRLNSVRANLSRKIKEIEKMSPKTLTKESKNHKKWLKCEEQKTRYEREKLHIETEIKRRKEQKNG